MHNHSDDTDPASRTVEPLAPTSEHSDPPATRRERLALAWFRMTGNMNFGITTVYLGAVSLIGIEGLILVLSFASVWPIAIPFVVGALAVGYFLRERLRELWRRLRSRS